MKKIISLTLIPLYLVSNNSYAANETGTANATILANLTFSEDQQVNFGEIMTAATGEAITLAAANSTTSATCSTLECTTGTAANGQFTISGTAGEGISISASQDNSITGPGTAMDYDATVSAASGTLDGSGDFIVYVGGTLTVGASQAAGSYSGSYTITASYQ